MMKKYDVIVAIDPDVEHSGVATLRPSSKELDATRLAFPDAVDYIRKQKECCEASGLSLIVVVEAAWLIKGNWHITKTERRARSASKGYDVGRNHETGCKLIEMCDHMGVETFAHVPLRKCWRGADGKITREELAYFTGFDKRTNQDERDAALLAWNFAGLPIRVSVGCVNKG